MRKIKVLLWCLQSLIYSEKLWLHNSKTTNFITTFGPMSYALFLTLSRTWTLYRLVNSGLVWFTWPHCLPCWYQRTPPFNPHHSGLKHNADPQLPSSWINPGALRRERRIQIVTKLQGQLPNPALLTPNQCHFLKENALHTQIHTE